MATVDELLAPLPADLGTLATRSTAALVQSTEAVQAVIDRLEAAKQRLANGEKVEFAPLAVHVKSSATRVAEKHKDWQTALSRVSKGVDKKFSTPLLPLFPSRSTSSGSPPPFSSDASVSALHTTLALHLARSGLFGTLETFLAESPETAALPTALLDNLRLLHAILHELGHGVVTSALAWLYANKAHGVDPSQDLEFELRKEEFIRTLLRGLDLTGASDPLLAAPPVGFTASTTAALAYGGTHFLPLHTPARSTVIQNLLTAPLYLPFSHLIASPYGHLFTPYIPSPAPQRGPTDLQTKFATVFFQELGMPRESALGVVVDVAPLAVGRIMKVGKVMKDKKTEWSAVDELPVEIPLPPTHRYHSIFACPVSKEQSTPTNPPMLLPCGHVIAKDSLQRLARGTPTLKCPYCPVVSQLGHAVRVHF